MWFTSSVIAENESNLLLEWKVLDYSFGGISRVRACIYSILFSKS